jgi:hypothetical protein
MKQFDIVANPFPRSRERQPFLVALQSDLMVRRTALHAGCAGACHCAQERARQPAWLNRAGSGCDHPALDLLFTGF